MTERAVSAALTAFADEVGGRGPVAVEGGRTRWSVGGALDEGTRLVRAPAGLVAYQPAEMTVRVGAGATVEELHHELGTHGQTTVLDGPPGATVGGVLAVGTSGIRRLRVGPARDSLLEARYVSAEGKVVVAGGPTVKNVTGFDLCRLLVGSLGTLGLIGEVVLRTRPLPASSRWFAGSSDPGAVLRALYRPSCVLWDGARTWALLEGHPADVDQQAAVVARLGLGEVDGPPALPAHRWSVPPADIEGMAAVAGHFVAEVGVGLVHRDTPAPAVAIAPEVRSLHRRLKEEFDPRGRCNPGRDPLAVYGRVVEGASR